MTNFPIILANGKSTKTISFFDRGLAYGDGVFETIKIRHRKAILWQEHKKRLLQGCHVLSIAFTEGQILDEEVERLAQQINELGVLKIIVTRGVGDRGYRIAKGVTASRLLCLNQYTPHPDWYRDEGIQVTVCKQRLATNQQLAGLKHLNRLEQVIARQEWEDEYQEGLMLDTEDNVVEGTMSNLFILEDSTLITPPLLNCGIEGVMRNYILNKASSMHFKTSEEKLRLSRIMHADTAFVCNSLIGVWPIRQINEQKVPVSSQFKNIVDCVAAV